MVAEPLQFRVSADADQPARALDLRRVGRRLPEMELIIALPHRASLRQFVQPVVRVETL